jgi:hypothetical protein
MRSQRGSLFSKYQQVTDCHVAIAPRNDKLTKDALDV